MKKGIVKSFVESKGYGFIEGDDGKTYFFHISDIKNRIELKDNIAVEFDEVATPKGYSAKNITILIDRENKVYNNNYYILPDDIYISKKDEVKGWSIIDRSSWRVISKSKDLNKAKDDILAYARDIGGNALVNYSYDKKTESESTSGGGTYYFSVHQFYGDVVLIGKPSNKGADLSDYEPIDNIATRAWLKDWAKTRKSMITGLIFSLFALIGVVYSYFFTLPDMFYFEPETFFRLFQNPVVEEKRRLLGHIIAFVILIVIFGKLFFNDYTEWLEVIKSKS